VINSQSARTPGRALLRHRMGGPAVFPGVASDGDVHLRFHLDNVSLDGDHADLSLSGNGEGASVPLWEGVRRGRSPYAVLREIRAGRVTIWASCGAKKDRGGGGFHSAVGSVTFSSLQITKIFGD
jgi:hypothetical protein